MPTQGLSPQMGRLWCLHALLGAPFVTPWAKLVPDSDVAMQFVLLGQSNVQPGRGQTAKISEDDQKRIRAVSQRAEVCGWYRDSSSCVDLSTISDPTTDGHPSESPLDVAAKGWFGPDLYTVLHLAEDNPTRRVRVIKVGGSGVTLAVDFAPSGETYHQIVSAMEQHVLPGVSVSGFVWVQGEGDTRDDERGAMDVRVAAPPRAFNAEDAAAYAANLQALICRLRAVTAKRDADSCMPPAGRPDLPELLPGTPFLMLEPWAGTSATCTPSDTSLANKAVLMQAVEKQLLNWPDFTLMAEDVARLPRYCNYTEAEIGSDEGNYEGYQGHYSTEGQIVLGYLVSRWLEWAEGTATGAAGIWSPGPAGAGGAWRPTQGKATGPGGESPALALAVATPRAPAGGEPSATTPPAAWELVPTAQAKWTCGAGQRNADASECLAAVMAASGGAANGHIKLVDTPLVPPGCSYSHVSGAALFNSGAGHLSSEEKDYQLVCATSTWTGESFGAALDEVLPDGGARRIMALYSCMVPSLETTCPAAKSYSAHRFSFDLPPDAHWLFFGPSYLREISNSIIAATADEIIGTADPLSRPQDSDDVYQCGTRSENTRCEPSTADLDRFTLTFANGAKLTSVTNDAQSQDEDDPEAMARLERMLPDGKFTHAFYMPPHEPDYFAEHAAAEADGRSVNSSLLGHTNCCVNSDVGLDGFHECVESRLTWQAVKRHVNRTTLVTPFNLGQASSSASSTADVFYTDYIDRVYPCGVPSSIPDDDPTYGVGYQLDSKEWLELGGGGCHRCTVVCEAADGSVDAPPHRCAGGPVLVLAEELLRSIA